MAGKLIFFVALATICEAAIIPVSHNWLSPGCRTRKEIDCLSGCCGSDIDYNHLFNALFPGTSYDTVGDFAFDGCSYDRTCDPADYFPSYPEVRTCKTCPGIDFETTANDFGCEGDYYCGCTPKCLTACRKCRLCYRRSPRCSPYACEKVIGPYYSKDISCA